MQQNQTLQADPASHFTAICRISAFVAICLALGWLGCFIWLREWDLVFTVLMLGAATLPCWVMAWRGHFFQALLLAQVVCLVYVCVFCYRYDVSNALYHRTTHLYLPIVALVGYISYHRSPSLPQQGVVLLTLLLFILFSCDFSFLSASSPSLLPFQAISSWLNPCLTTLLFSAGIVAMRTDFSARKRRIKAIQHALYNDQFLLLYQPLVNSSGQVTGAEALIRWQHPGKGMISPADFIPEAQEAGLMPMVGEWVIGEACKTLLSWQACSQTRHLTLSVNITADHFMQPDFVRKLMYQASLYQIPCQKMRLELTESVFVSEPLQVAEKMEILAKSGFRFSLDDFGTGFSSLGSLRKLPFSQIKIDRSFVADESLSDKGAVIVRNIVRMGAELKLEVVAEGIENQAQWAVMKEYGCRAFQGFLFSRPVSAASFMHYATRHSPDASSSASDQ